MTATKPKKKQVVQQRSTKLGNGKKVVVLLGPYQLAVNAGILQAAKDLGVDLGGRREFYFYPEAHYNGNKKLQPRTKDTYSSHYRQLWRWWYHEYKGKVKHRKRGEIERTLREVKVVGKLPLFMLS